MADLQATLGTATARLAAAGVASPRWDAEQLAAFVLGVSRSQLALARTFPDADLKTYQNLVHRRTEREPLQHLTGRVGFRHIDLLVGRGVFVPRPETETVAGWAISTLASLKVPFPIVVDLCTGSGAIALAIANEVRDAKVHGVDVDESAIGWAQRNSDARIAAGDPPVTFHHHPVVDALPKLEGNVDLVISNPPYVSAGEMEFVEPEVRDFDPTVAVMAGDDGLAVIREVAVSAARLLRVGGVLVIEHSDRQGIAVPELLTAAGWSEVADHADLAGRPRFTSAIRAAKVAASKVATKKVAEKKPRPKKAK